MKWVIVVGTLVLCSCASPKLPNTETASEQFSVLGRREKAVASEFYNLGQSDAVKRWYWSQRDSQRNNGISESQPVPLERRYVSIPIPEHVDPDGTIREASTEAIEVVRFMDIRRTKAGRSLFIVK